MRLDDVPHPHSGKDAHVQWISLLVAAASVVAALFMFGETSTGDSEIYFVFAKSMWESGPFYFGFEGPVGGATSPIWAIVLSVPYIVDFPPLLFGRLVTFVIFLLNGVAIFSLTRRVTDRVSLGTLAAALWFVNPMARHFGVIPYETMLGILLISCFLIILHEITDGADFSTRSFLALGLVVGLLGLTRPDSAILVAIGFSYLAWYSYAEDPFLLGKVAVSVVVAVVVLSPYHLYLFLNSGDLVPSSLRARSWYFAVRYSHMTLVERISFQFNDMFLNVKNLLQNGPLFGLLALSTPAVVEERRNYYTFLFASCLLFTAFYLVEYPYSNFERYTLILTPYLCLLTAITVYTGYDRLHGRANLRRVLDVAVVVVLLGTLVSGIAFPYLLAELDIGRDPTNIGDVEVVDSMNEHTEPHDKILLREIQLQYHLDVQAVSSNGIIGGGILEYLRNEDKKVGTFIRETNITLAKYNGAYESKREYDGTLLDEFVVRARQGEDGFDIQGLTFTQVSTDPNLYCIEYESHDCDHHVPDSRD